ncbi:SGNH/GDSL hydrolase family protein [Nocardiopsis sp. HNM0947]|uniref:SGNH/GDSL hydrolase family protein n=1 Tax=Nocardiopsis coralli TaxID=2772213 RepID=A0ABR9P6W1_9ACTN|nr:SGNH/GDSL hydrolase family protein [Nocardiopsis coralli]MBE2999574.1 SGNH/GDSL hydrolase family protein [Nocardiopsis coralli]
MAEHRPLRYVALGDSQTEGVGDGHESTGWRGFADRFAVLLARHHPSLSYANLAVRGRRAHQVHHEQLAPALGLEPDVATVVAGVNDVLRPRFEAAQVAGHVESVWAALRGQGAQVLSMTFPDPAPLVPAARPVSGRVRELNALLRRAARRQGVLLAEMEGHAVVGDARLWSQDRLHAGPEGHARMAAALAQVWGLPGSDDSWTRPLPGPAPVGRAGWQALAGEVGWAARFVGPWVLRRVRGRSSGDGRSAKRPLLMPVR